MPGNCGILPQQCSVESRLENMQQEKELKHLVLPVDTRWGTIEGFESLRSSEALLHQIVSEREFTSSKQTKVVRQRREKFRENIMRDTFVANLDHAFKEKPDAMGISINKIPS